VIFLWIITMDHLQTEARNPASTDLDQLAPLQLVQLMNAEDAKIIPAVASQAAEIAKAIETIATRLECGGRLIYAGAGTSGRLGVLDAAECPPTFNSPPEQVVGLIAGGTAALTRAVEGAEDHPEFAERDLEQIGLCDKDVLVGIATSGRTPYVLGAVEYARRKGAFAVGLACNADADLIGHVDLAITPVVGPEILSGSTRLKAGTATKLVLNMLTTGAMVRLGKTFGNLMVDVRVTNEKLALRVNRIMRQLTGLGKSEADVLLRQCDGELKTALVCCLANFAPEEARARLQTAGGRVRKVVEQNSSEVDAQRSRPWPAGPRNVEHADIVLGIDGGGTRTVALLARVEAGKGTKKTFLGRGVAGPSNMQAVGAEKALEALELATVKAFGNASLTPGRVASACLGLAGAGRPKDQAFIHAWAERVGLAAKVEVTSDARLLLATGTPQGWGVAVIAGTGSMVLAEDREGHTARAGGWGYLLGDEGSSYALALAGVRAVTRAADGCGGPTLLSKSILQALKLKEPQGLIPAVYHSDLDRVALANLAPLVLAAADQGDAVAASIIKIQAAQLATGVIAVVKKLGLNQVGLPLALAGGVFEGSANYRQRFLEEVAASGIEASPVAVVYEPAEGAVRLALSGPVVSETRS
jgi:N-acetylmuramic acid 6-phosphate etherase